MRKTLELTKRFICLLLAITILGGIIPVLAGNYEEHFEFAIGNELETAPIEVLESINVQELEFDQNILERQRPEIFVYEEIYMSENRRSFQYLLESGYSNIQLRQRFAELFGTGYSGEFIFHNYRDIFDLEEDEIIDEAFLRILSGYRVDFRFQNPENSNRHDTDAFKISLDGMTVDSEGRVLIFPDKHINNAEELEATDVAAVEVDMSEFHDILLERLLSMPVPEMYASVEGFDLSVELGASAQLTDAFTNSNNLVSLDFVSRTATSVTFDAWFSNNDPRLNLLDKFDQRNGWTRLLHGGSQPAAVSQRYTATNLSPNAAYTFVAWTVVGNNWTAAILEPPNMPALQLTLFSRSSVDFRLDRTFTDILGTDATGIALRNNFLDATNQAFYVIREFIGGPQYYTGGRMEIRNTRGLPRYTEGWSGWPIFWQLQDVHNDRHFYALDNARMMRATGIETTEIPIHEIGHNFDNYRWSFETEAFAVFFTYYYYSTTGRRMVNAGGSGAFRGNEFRTYMRNHAYRGLGQINHNEAMRRGVYSSYSMAYTLANIAGSIGWQPFTETFRDFTRLQAHQVPNTNIGKLNLFMTFLRQHSGRDVIAMIPANARTIYQGFFGGTIQYVTIPAVTITAPQTNASFTVGNSVTITANGDNPTWRMAMVVRQPNGVQIWLDRGTLTNSTTRTFTPTMPGLHTIRVDARSFADADTRTAVGVATRTFNVSALPIPVAPGQPSASNVTQTSATISWSAVANATQYHLYRNNARIWSGSALSTGVTGLASNTTHNFTVRASNASGTSGHSTARSVTTLSAPIQLTVHPRGLFTVVETVGATNIRPVQNTIALSRNTTSAAAQISTTSDALRYSWAFTQTNGAALNPPLQSTMDIHLGTNRNLYVTTPSAAGTYRLTLTIRDGSNNVIRTENYTVFVTHGPMLEQAVHMSDGFNIYWLERGLYRQGMSTAETFYALNRAFFERGESYQVHTLWQPENFRSVNSTANLDQEPPGNCASFTGAIIGLTRALGIQPSSSASIRVGVPLDNGDILRADLFMMRPGARALDGNFNATHIKNLSESNRIMRPEEGAWIFNNHAIARYGGRFFDPMFGLEGNSQLSHVHAELSRLNRTIQGWSFVYEMNVIEAGVLVTYFNIAVNRRVGGGYYYHFIPSLSTSARAAGETRIIAVPSFGQSQSQMASGDTQSLSQWEPISNDDWISVSQTIIGVNDDNGAVLMSIGDIGGVQVTVAPNPSAQMRTGSISINSPSGSDTIHVHQDGINPWINAANASMSFGADGIEGTIPITSNVNWFASSDADWLELNFSLGVGSEDLPFVIEENDTTKARTAMITISGAGAIRTVSVTQLGQEVSVTISPGNATVWNGESKQFTAVTNSLQNVIWSVEGADPWGTTINATGLLTVSSWETAENITVRVTLTCDPTVSSTAIVTVYSDL